MLGAFRSLVLLCGAAVLLQTLLRAHPVGATNTVQQITSLPNLTFTPSFNQYSGYITVNATLGKNLFYWFVESSETDPSEAPVLLWMQGGPGCSGLLGMFTENGPFSLLDNSTIGQNPMSWNRYANVIYLEQPAGVGFSYSNSSQGYTTNDNQTAEDNYVFLQEWFSAFPQYASNELWLTGESYAGVYIPTLAYQILTGSDAQLSSQFKGFMLGNPVIHCPQWVAHSSTLIMNMWYWHGLASFKDRQLWFAMGCENNVSNDCTALYAKVEAAIGPYDSDNLYMDFCTGNGTLDFTESTPNCYSLDQRLEHYLNSASVQEAIHAEPPPAGRWEYCVVNSNVFNYTSYGQNMLDYYNAFFELDPSLRILVYSGDIDIATVPHAYTQLCLNDLNRPITKPWARWTVSGPKIPQFIPENQEKDNITAGYQEIHDTYTYATVRGAGHEVPTFQPWFAFNMFYRFIIKGGNL